MKELLQRKRNILIPLVVGVMLLSLIVSCTSGAKLSAAIEGITDSGQTASETTTNISTTADVSTLGDKLVQVSNEAGDSVVSIRTNRGEGSGVIYDSSGLILTNSHVVQDAEEITVTLSDGQHFQGEVSASSEEFDLAAVKVDGNNLPAAPLGNSSSIKSGQFVIAIGNPYGYDHTVTTGVISAVNRAISLGQGSYSQPMIQTDAAINPGNSGGPLIDLNGNVVGITTVMAAPQGYPAQGLGFAIPIDTAKRIIPQLMEHGKVVNSGQAYLGLTLSDLATQSATQGYFFRQPQPQDYGVDHGALVREVVQGSPAAQGGIKANDVIVSFDGHEVYTLDELMQYIVEKSPGQKVSLELVRDGERVDLSLTLGEMPVQQ
ncbi:MAG: S1C family serine protease [Chloroflexota bacterium]